VVIGQQHSDEQHELNDGKYVDDEESLSFLNAGDDTALQMAHTHVDW